MILIYHKTAISDSENLYFFKSKKYFLSSGQHSMKLSKKIMNKINDCIADAEALSFTTDCWSNNANKTFMSLTCHGIDSSWKRFTFVSLENKNALRIPLWYQSFNYFLDKEHIYKINLPLLCPFVSEFRRTVHST